MSKFTPGPWETAYRKNGNGMFRQDIFDDMGRTIAVASWHPVRVDDRTTRTDREDNAHLIAAAPEMYEELVQANDIIRKLGEWVMAHEHDTEIAMVDIRLPERQSAIAKAEGRK